MAYPGMHLKGIGGAPSPTHPALCAASLPGHEWRGWPGFGGGARGATFPQVSWEGDAGDSMAAMRPRRPESGAWLGGGMRAGVWPGRAPEIRGPPGISPDRLRAADTSEPTLPGELHQRQAGFSWMIPQHEYSLPHHPLARLRPASPLHVPGTLEPPSELFYSQALKHSHSPWWVTCYYHLVQRRKLRPREGSHFLS